MKEYCIVISTDEEVNLNSTVTGVTMVDENNVPVALVTKGHIVNMPQRMVANNYGFDTYKNGEAIGNNKVIDLLYKKHGEYDPETDDLHTH